MIDDRGIADVPAGIELRHLRALVAVSEELHFGRAAQRVHVSQPTLSRAIADLEALVGARLVDRGSRNVTLTEAGVALEAAAVAALAEIATGVCATQEGGPLRLGFVNSLGQRWLASVRRRLSADGHELETAVIGFEHGFAPLRSQIDVAVMPLPLAPPVGLEYAVLGRTEPWVALPARHPLAGSPRVPLAELFDEPFVVPPSHELWRENFDMIARAQGKELRRGARAESMYEALALVAAGEGWSISVAQSDFHPWKGVVLREASGIERVRVVAAWDQARSGPRQRLLVEALEVASSR